MSVSAEVEAQVAALLGRTPRGLEEVVVSSAAGAPQVIRVRSLVDDKPFPTLFWLVDPALNYRIDQEEAAGLIARLQADIDAQPSLRRAMQEDHAAHIALRERYMSDSVRRQLLSLGYAEVLQHKGIGGIADFSRIRCLHTWYAAHLVEANTVGQMLDEYWQIHGQAV